MLNTCKSKKCSIIKLTPTIHGRNEGLLDHSGIPEKGSIPFPHVWRTDHFRVKYTMQDLVLQYLLYLSSTVVLPTTVWIVSTSRIFTRLRSFTQENYENRIRETLEDTILERICQLMPDLFSEFGLTLPGCVHLPAIVRNLLNEAGAPDRLTVLSNMYQSLVESGIQSPFFVQVVQAVLSVMGGGG